MRRQHLRLLANGTRLLLLAVCGAAGGTAAIWHWRPEWVDAADDWLVHRHVESWRERARAIGAEADPTRQQEQYAALLRDLQFVQRQDRLADVVGLCLSELSRICEQRGELDAAAKWLEQRVEFDDHDLIAAARLGALECRVPDRRDTGLQRLADLCARFPGQPTATNAFVRALAEAGRPADAARALAEALKALQSRLWSLAWDPGTGTGIDRFERRVDLMPARDGADTVLRCNFAEPVSGLALFLPAFHAARMTLPRLETSTGRVVDFAKLRLETNELLVADGAMASYGGSGSSLAAAFTTPIPAGTSISIRLRETPWPQGAYDDALRSPALWNWLSAEPAPADAELVATLRRARACAAATGDFQVFWSEAGQNPEASRCATRRTIPEPTADGCTFGVEWPIGAPAAFLRIDLPDGVGVAWELTRCDLRAGDKSTTIDLATAELRNPQSIERRDGRFHVTGTDPYFSVALPAPLTLDGAAIQGVAR